MDNIYFIQTTYDDGALCERICDNWVEDIGYFTSFKEAKANAKEVLIMHFNCPEETIEETEYGFESDDGRCYGFTVYCATCVHELKPFEK